jgi:hypothetical protein
MPNNLSFALAGTSKNYYCHTLEGIQKGMSKVDKTK